MTECTETGCRRRHRARGLCSTHYNQRYQPNRHRKVEMSCAYCGAVILRSPTSKYARRFCDEHHAALWQFPPSTPVTYAECGGHCGRGRWSASTTPVPWTCRRCAARQRLQTGALLPSMPVVWVNGLCLRCGQPFTTYRTHDGAGSRWCSHKCLKHDARARRRARLAGVHIEYFARWRVFESYGWTCSICGVEIDAWLVDELHPMYATLDHLVPLSLGGSHTAKNVRPAHRVCNALKGDAYDGSPF